jgi:hypothetical protein
VLRPLIAVLTTIALLTGCAGRPWPTAPVALSAQTFTSGGDIATIDVLPLDLHLWAEPGYEGDLERLRAGAEVNIMGAAFDALSRHDYAIGGTLDWSGAVPGGQALSHDDLVATVDSLSRYGATAAQHPGQLPVPFLPVRLGTATGADATLYVGGWGYVARPRESTGEQVAKVVVIGLVIISVIAIVAMIASKSKGKSHGGSGNGHIRNFGRGGGQALSASRGIGHARTSSTIGRGLVDAFGRIALDVAVSVPSWSEDPALPHEGEASQMYLEMTLVDNRTGLALWHSRQIFPASAASASDTARVARTVLGSLPHRLARPQAAALTATP